MRGAIRAGTYETIASAWLSLATLGRLLVNAGLQWWWPDPIAARATPSLALREGPRGLAGALGARSASIEKAGRRGGAQAE